VSFQINLGSLPPVTTSSRVKHVLPSKTSAEEKTAELQAAIDTLFALGGGLVELDEGDYYTGTLIRKDNVSIAGYHGRQARLKPRVGWTGAADDRTNALIKADGAINTGKLNTTLSAVAYKDATSIVLTAVNPGPIAGGDYLVIEGASDPYLESDGAAVVHRAVVKIDTSYVSGTTIPLAWDLAKQFEAGATVKAVTPVLDGGLEDLIIDGSGAAQPLAVGVLERFTFGLRARGLSFQGISRAGLELVAAEVFGVPSLHSLGEVNCILYLDSAFNGSWGLLTSDPRGVRHHASGVPRGGFFYDSRCTNIKGGDANLARMCIGGHVRGGKHLTFGDLIFRDMISDQAVTQMVAAGMLLSSAQHIGAGLTLGSAPIGQEQFGYGLRISSVIADDCRHPGQGAAGCGVLLHDWFGISIDEIFVRNSGFRPDLVRMDGVLISDCNGKLERIVCQGVLNGLRTENNVSSTDIDLYEFDGNSGDGVNVGGPAALFDGGQFGTPRIRRFIWANTFGTPIQFDADSFQGTALTFDRFTADGWENGRTIVCHANGVTMAVGDLVEFNGTVTANSYVWPKVITPQGANLKCGVVVSGGSTFVLVCPLSSTIARVTMATAGAVAVGDLIESQNGVRTGLVNNGTAVPLGKAITTKAAATAGSVVIVPP
jgi:hypothetical protein